MKKSIIALLLLNICNLNSATYYFIVDKEKEQSYVIDSDKVWNPSTSLFSEWLDRGVPYDLSSFSPEIISQDGNFIQSQAFKQEQYQMEQQRHYEERLDIYQNVGEPIEHTRIFNGTNTRDITVESSDWVDDGVPYDCSDWTGGSGFVIGETTTQTRTCKQDQNKENIYKLESTTLEVLNFNRVYDVDETKEVTVSIDKEETIDLSYSHISSTQTVNLSSTYDLSKSYIEVISITAGEVCKWPAYPYNSCTMYFSNLMPLITFNGGNSIKIEKGATIGSTSAFKNRSNSQIQIKIKQLSGVTVQSGVTNIDRNQTINVALSNTNEDSLYFANYRNGAGYTWNAYPYNSPTSHSAFQPSGELSSYNNIRITAPNASGNTGSVSGKVSWFVVTKD